MRELNVLKSFTEFEFEQLDIPEQDFEDFKSKYLDIYDTTRNPAEPGASIINEVDFELELIQRDEINVAYILRLIEELHGADGKSLKQLDYEKKKQDILDTMQQEAHLRSKRELIEKFMNTYMPQIKRSDNFREIFDTFWSKEREVALEKLSQDEGLDVSAVKQLISEYQFSNKEPLREEVFAALKTKPKLLERKTIFDRVVSKLVEFVKVFEDDMGL